MKEYSKNIEINTKTSHSKTKSICYLNTILCDILKFKENNVYLETIKNFRINTLEKDKKYKYLLAEFDVVSPVIANLIEKDPFRKRIANIYFNNFIMPIIALIQSNEIEKAIEKCHQMTDNLKILYNLNNYDILIAEINNNNTQKYR